MAYVCVSELLISLSAYSSPHGADISRFSYQGILADNGQSFAHLCSRPRVFTVGITSPLAVDKPQNGVAGLRSWRYDLFAGLMVSLVSLPFSLGIAIASGAPLVAGLISAIIAGLIYPFLGGSYVTISGPAAGLAPALLAAMTASAPATGRSATHCCSASSA